MRKFAIPCQFGGDRIPFDFYIGLPSPGFHPLHFQSAWLRELRGGAVPPKVLESFRNLLGLAQQHAVSFEDLCAYALNVVLHSHQQQKEE